MSEHAPAPAETLPESDVSLATGLVGLVALLGWLVVARKWPVIAEALSLPGPREVMAGPNAALAGILVVGLAMAGWAVFVEKVHRRPSTGIDWSRRNAFDPVTSLTKINGLWVTWLVLAALYVLLRWYWDGSYEYAMRVLAAAGVVMAVLVVPYVLWLDRVMEQPRDHAWHFGAMITFQPGWDIEEVKRHWRAWLIKGFFGAFMISILPGNWANVVGADYALVFSDPFAFGSASFNFLFLVDVLIGTVGYIVTFRPLDAHIRSGNPFLGGWLAALLCYPPFVWGILGNGMVLGYEHNVGGWTYWMANNPVLAWSWALLLAGLTALYAWATGAFGLRFSNLTYRGVITNGPYRLTRHPAYLSKNLFWWASVLPFLVTNGSTADAVRNTFCLLCVNGIYYWRARTEEAHLLAEDARYAQYHAWMGRHGPLTAPLARLTRLLDPRRRVAQPAL